MYVTILRMISTGSLAAFSASVASAGFGQVQQARSVGGPTLQTAPPAQSSAPASLGAPSSGRILPRGSLLDLSV
jgi:hypothetical protein